MGIRGCPNLMLPAMKKKINMLLLYGTVLLVTAGCSTSSLPPAAGEKLMQIIPAPVSVQAAQGEFILKPSTRIRAAGGSDELLRTAQIFAEDLMPASGMLLKVRAGAPGNNSINLSEDPALGIEEYVLEITPRRIDIKGGSAAGVFYGLQSLRQLILPDEAGTFQSAYSIPAGTVCDHPAFAYRGNHFDIARHFFFPEEVMKFIDMMVLHKQNTLHWHLSDDQGWRVEIESRPLLTEVGSQRSGTLVVEEDTRRWVGYDDVPYGGFYTKGQIRDVVSYAAERFVTVIPEIDVPGHNLAALAAYPELGCTSGPYEVCKLWGVFEDVLCAGNDESFRMLEDVLTELLELFPSEYIHMGGDECPKTRWEACPKCQARIKEEGLADEYGLQSYFMQRIEKWLTEHGRKMIGWDEILEGGLSETATVMSWRGMSGAKAAAAAGNSSILTPNSHCYFDYYQSPDRSTEPYSIGGNITVEKVYGLDPYEGIPEEHRKYIRGVQSNLWTEYIKTIEHVQYMMLPRLAALAETAWSYGQKDYQRFRAGMENMRKVYDANGFVYAEHMFLEPGI